MTDDASVDPNADDNANDSAHDSAKDAAHSIDEPSEPSPFEGPEWAASSAVTSGSGGAGGRVGRVRISMRKRQVLRRRRRFGGAFLVVGGLLFLVVVYLAITGLLARSELNQVRAGVGKLRAQIAAGDLPGARKTAAALESHASSAHTLTTGPVWRLAADLPGGGQPLQTVRGIAAVADRLGSTVLPQLVHGTEQLDPNKLRRADGGIDLAPIVSIAPDLAHATSEVHTALANLINLPSSTWLSAVDTGRVDVIEKLASLGQTIQSANLAAQVAPTMLGQDKPQRYLLAFESEAELRGLGGLPGAFAIVLANHGKLTFERFESDSTLEGTPSGLKLGADYDNLYDGANAPSDYLDSDVSSHFPYSAQIWTAMWQRRTGQHLDGAAVVDPTALSYLLAVTGPARLPNGTPITSSNVVSLTQQQIYAKFPALDQTARKNYQLSIAKAISKRLLAGTQNTTALVRAAGRAAGERRLQAWSADPVVERSLAQTVLGGTVSEAAVPFTGLAINNAAANKLDYYLHVSLTWQRSGCGATRDVTATIKATNDSPAKLPVYVLGNTGKPGYPQRPGDNVLLFGYYATRGAAFTSVTLNGKPFTAGSGAELGHPVFTVTLPLPRGSTQTVVFHLSEPGLSGSPTVLRQPMVNPMAVKVQSSACN